MLLLIRAIVLNAKVKSYLSAAARVHSRFVQHTHNSEIIQFYLIGFDKLPQHTNFAKKNRASNVAANLTKNSFETNWFLYCEQIKKLDKEFALG
jgi:hypothetical protein